MTTLTKTLSLSALTVALASGIGFAYAQSNGTTGDPLINPDPNATLSTPTTPAQRPMAGEAAESNTTYGHTRDATDASTAPGTKPMAGAAAQSNNSYGNTRDTNSSGGMANDGMTKPPANDTSAAPSVRAPRADRN